MKFRDQVVLITGSDTDLGIETALYFAKEKAKLALVGQSQTKFGKLLKKLKALSVQNEPLIIYADFAVECERIICETIDLYGRLNILINGTGTGIVGSIIDLNMEDYDTVMSSNLRGVIEMTKQAIPYLEQTKGSIINISSICSTKPFEGFLAYCISKAALDTFTKCVSIELAPKGIRINSINPGFNIGDFMPIDQHKRAGDEFIVADTDSETFNRNKHIEKCVNAIVFFATSHEETFVSGAILPIIEDGVVSMITV